MARAPLTDLEVEQVLQAPKIINEDVQWRLDPYQCWAKCELNVENELKANLRLYMNWNLEEPSLFSSSLVLNNAFRIAGIDFNGSHRNRHADNNLWRGETHKHKWTEKCRDSWAYTPEDIFRKEIQEVFKIFCKECNIKFKGKFLSLPPKQERLFREM